jgi:iron complex outermembrane receptor protein
MPHQVLAQATSVTTSGAEKTQPDTIAGNPGLLTPAEQRQAAPDQSSSEIVVTGTLLRGIAPVGTNVIGVSRSDVVATGAASTNDLLATIPQISNFNSFPTGSASFGQPIAQTNLRGLGASGGTTTLVLLNGHRLVGSGILQTYVDPTIIPPGMIDRVEVIPDGGSSIYGSDAIGGVINFITRKRFSGIEANAKYGWVGGYKTVDGNITAGRDWGTGSFSASYAYAWHNDILGIDRDYVTQDNRAQGGSDRRSATCAQANVTVAGVSYALPGRTPGTQNRCDTSDYASIYPRERRHSAFATLDQQLSDRLSTNITAYFSTRRSNTSTAPLSTNSTITSANPFFSPIGTETSQSVAFDYSSVFGNRTDNPARFDSWGITPSFDYAAGGKGDWHVRLLGNYGHSYSNTVERTINADAASAALRATTTATALNPYNLSATNPAVLATIRDFTNYSEAQQDLAEARVVADGTLFQLPGGGVRLAVGGEYHWEGIDARIAFGPSASAKTNRAKATRRVKSVYSEVFVPIFGADNAIPGIAALDLTGSVRYDDYNDVGGTTNPKIGFNYRPVRWLTFRGNYGTSFHAPSLADTRGSVDTRVTFIPVSTNRATGSPASDLLRPFLFISGGSPDLKPEKANTWSLGADVKPIFLPGLSASLTYYNISFRDQISVNSGAFTAGPNYFADPTNAPFYILSPTLAQATTFARGARADNFSSLADFFAANNPYAIYDLRRYNRGRLKQDGLDYNVSYAQPTNFGSINASFSGTYTLHRRTQEVPTAAWVNRLKNGVNRFNFVSALGAQVGPVTGRATLTHSGGYPIIGDPLQSSVGSFNTVDLFFSLDLEKLGLLAKSAVTLNVDNVGNENPPYRTSGSGYANGLTLGRLISVGLRTKF